MNDLVWNEQTKLLANVLNGMVVAIFSVGVLAPAVAALYSAGGKIPLGSVILGGVGWGVLAVIFHVVARRVLRRLKP